MKGHSMRRIPFVLVMSLVVGNFSQIMAQEPSFDEINVFGGETIDIGSSYSENTENGEPAHSDDEGDTPVRAINLLDTPFRELTSPSQTQLVVDEPLVDEYVEEKKNATYVGVPVDTHTQFNQYEVCTDNRNACGTTSLSMILADQGLLEKDLKAAQDLDHEVRPWGGFSAPYDLRRYARWHGLYTSSWNNASFEDLEARLARGNSIQCLVSGGSSPHWIYVMGVETDAKTGEKTVIVGDPGDHSSSRLSQEAFEKKWKEPNTGLGGKFMNDAAGYQNYMLVYDKDYKNVPFFSRNFEVLASENMIDGISDLANFPSQIGEGKVGTGLGHLTGGAVRVITAIPGVVGSVVDTAGDTVLDWSCEKWEEGGVGNKILGGGGYVVGGVVKATGAVTKFAGNVVAAVGEGVGSTFESVGMAADKAVSTVWGWFTD